ncbi:hypothetical protein LPA07_08200 [Lactiplantibacillus paraplantarum]|nr:hypothetical protein LPA07_08200 [Lactiplantibacillus paraplantarum]
MIRASNSFEIKVAAPFINAIYTKIDRKSINSVCQPNICLKAVKRYATIGLTNNENNK